MASCNDIYSLQWDNHTIDFSIAFQDLLKEKEFVDVTLVADGNLFRAHRLVLSAISPYFREMFTQMPPNQQAFGKSLNLFLFSLNENFNFFFRASFYFTHNFENSFHERCVQADA